MDDKAQLIAKVLQSLYDVDTTHLTEQRVIDDLFPVFFIPKFISCELDRFFSDGALFGYSANTLLRIALPYSLYLVGAHLEAGQGYLFFGPFLMAETNYSLYQAIVEQNALERSDGLELECYYNELPVLSQQKILKACELVAVFLCGLDSFELLERDLSHAAPPPAMPPQFAREERDALMMQNLERRYALENMLMDYIAKGDFEKCLSFCGSFAGKLQGLIRTSNKLRNEKNLAFVSNTLFRKAAEQGAVHCVYIDEISSSYSRRIELAASVNELYALRGEMLRDYCALVKRRSLRNYSSLVRQAIDYIDLHLSGELSLRILAGIISVSPNYLSNLFSKEVGQGIAEFINRRRVDEGIRLIQNSNLPISQIAGMVGYNEVNYFTNVFKKHTGKTPTQYRGLTPRRKGKQCCPQA